MRAVTYARISTDMQSETSISEQTRRSKQYAELREWDIVDSFEDTGSGMNTERSGFKEMMERADEWDVVIAYKLDRFHRSSNNAQAWAAKIGGMGKNFVALDIDVDTSKAMGMAIFKIITTLNEMEVQVTRERTTMGLEAVKNSGRHVGKPPYGYASVYARTEDDSDKGILEINPEEADVVKLIFDLSDKGKTLSDIAAKLTVAGHSTRTGKPIWSPVVIQGIIERRLFYEGHYYDSDNEMKRYTWETIL
jgi:site-specific DNA recombinase